MDESTCKDFILSNGSENTIRSSGHYQKIRSAFNKLDVKLAEAA